MHNKSFHAHHRFGVGCHVSVQLLEVGLGHGTRIQQLLLGQLGEVLLGPQVLLQPVLLAL
jgi:hypothetical protein